MNNKINEIFRSLKPYRKDQIRILLSNKYKISIDTVKVKWLYGSKIPVKYQNEVLEILKDELKKQIEKDEKILLK